MVGRCNTLHKHGSAVTQAQHSLFLAAVKLAAVTAATTTAREQRSLSTWGVGCMDTRDKGPSGLPVPAQECPTHTVGHLVYLALQSAALSNTLLCARIV
uniref:Uncharacterized protein n=1 Tax=Rhipicephalus zambeziensis TaxID=60191 RepID=A0A224Y7E1_9ACAR